jgi:hypothetical protein
LKQKIQRLYKKILFNSQRVAGLERQSVLLGETRAAQIRSYDFIETLADSEFSVFSQWGEDGILAWLVDVIGPMHETFIEFGVEDYREANTRYLIMSRNWSGLVIDGSQQNINAIRADAISYKYDLQSVCSFITKDNIGKLVSDYCFGAQIGILSIDIDGVDYWVLENIKTPAAIVVVEYNDVFGDAPVSVPYDASFVRLEKHWSGMYWGASLTAFRHLLEARDYVFVGTNRVGTNAFFILNSHWDDIAKRMKQVKAWPCKMREVRNSDGSLARKTYRESRDQISHLPVVNVKTGEVTTVGQSIDRKTS